MSNSSKSSDSNDESDLSPDQQPLTEAQKDRLKKIDPANAYSKHELRSRCDHTQDGLET